MSNSWPAETVPAIAVIQEPLAPYYPFIWSGAFLKRAQTPQLVSAYLRWQYVRRGGIQDYTHLSFAPTGWEGYVVGLPPEEQAATLQRLGEELLRGVNQVGKQAGVPADRLLVELFEEKLTRRLAQLIEPVFYSALMTMRGIGSEGFDMHAYSKWRTTYEQEQYRLAQALHREPTAEGKQKITDKMLANRWELKDQVANVTRTRAVAAALYLEVHHATEQQVSAISQAIASPLVVDTQAGNVRYVLPATPGLNISAEANISGSAPEWYLALRNIPMLGHPLIRAAIAPETENGTDPPPR